MKVTSAANVEYHARIVLEKALMRRLIAETSGIAGRAYSQTEDAFDLSGPGGAGDIQDLRMETEEEFRVDGPGGP